MKITKKIKMLIKRINCKHKKQEYVTTYLVPNGDGKWVTRHEWKCKDCGKIL